MLVVVAEAGAYGYRPRPGGGFAEATQVVVLGQTWRHLAVKRLNVRPEAVRIIRNGSRDPGRPDRSQPTGTSTILLLGDVNYWKGIGEMIEALSTPDLGSLSAPAPGRSKSIVMSACVSGRNQQRVLAIDQNRGRALPEAQRRILDDPDLAAKLGRHGRGFSNPVWTSPALSGSFTRYT